MGAPVRYLAGYELLHFILVLVLADEQGQLRVERAAIVICYLPPRVVMETLVVERLIG